MKLAPILSLAVGAVAVMGLGYVFVQNASPYLTIDKLDSSTRAVHVAGKIVPGSLEDQRVGRDIRFRLKDATGEIPVVYNGPAVSNLASATQVVVVGEYKDKELHSKEMLVKCPSKYESGKSASK